MPCCRNVAWKDCRIASWPPKPLPCPPTLVKAAPTLPCSIGIPLEHEPMTCQPMKYESLTARKSVACQCLAEALACIAWCLLFEP